MGPETIVNDINKRLYSQKQAMNVRQGPFFSERKKLSASNWPKDVVRRAANIEVDSRSSFVDSPLDALRPPLLRVMQDTGHCILSPPKKKVSAGQYVNSNRQNAQFIKSFTIILGDYKRSGTRFVR